MVIFNNIESFNPRIHFIFSSVCITLNYFHQCLTGFVYRPFTFLGRFILFVCLFVFPLMWCQWDCFLNFSFWYFVSSLYKYSQYLYKQWLIQLNIKETIYLIKKCEEVLNRHFSKDIQTVNRPIKRYSASLMIQFSHSVMSNSLRPHELQHARLLYPSSTPRACSNSCPSSWWCHPTISSSDVPFSSRLQFFPTSGSFLRSQFFISGG